MRWILPVILGLVVGCASTHKEAGQRPSYRRVLPTIAFEMIRDTPDLFLLDLRREEEFAKGHLRRAVHIPLEELGSRLAELQAVRGRTFLVYCRPDSCGAEGMTLLRSQGFEDVILMVGGIEAWIAAGFESMVVAGE